MTQEDLKKLEHGSDVFKLIQEAEEAKRSLDQFIESQAKGINEVKKINIEINKTDTGLYLFKIRHDFGIGGTILVPESDMSILNTNLKDFLNDYIKMTKDIFDKI